MNVLFAIVRRELRLALRQGSDSIMVLTFFVLAVVLFPFGVGPELNILERIAPGVIWVNALLAAMLSLDRLFQADYEDGSLELLVLAPISLEIVVFGKIIAHWLTTGLPLIIISPLLAVLLNLNNEGFAALFLSMLLGTPSLSLIGAIGASLVLGARRGGVLLSLLILPLYIPILIFGVGAIDAAAQGFSPNSHFFILAAILSLAAGLTPIATAAAIRQAI